jgi:hypothetical protein
MIDKSYAFHKPSARSIEATNRLREIFSQIERTILEVCPNSRQRALAITNNEQAAMWAIKSVVVNDEDSEVTTG